MTNSEWRVKTFNRQGVYYMETRCKDEADARETALRQLTVQGQKSFRTEVYGPAGRIAVYKGGKEVKR